MDERELKSALEAIIFASGEPVPAARISLVLGVPEEDVFSCAAGLAEEYEHEGRGIRLVRLDKSLQMCSAPQYAKTIARVIEHRAPPKLSPPALETLAVIAYFQPVTRAYVDEV
ncbi:MAG: SMC-Scp complex subunit ScpB, partial [Oscillospiraceae bacterium]